MRKLKGELDGSEAWVEIPDEWLSGDYDIYVRAYAEAEANDHAPPTCRLAGVLALILQGRVKAEVPGLKLDGEPDLMGITARAEGFLLMKVAIPLEATQIVPFGLSEPSANGTKGTAWWSLVLAAIRAYGTKRG